MPKYKEQEELENKEEIKEKDDESYQERALTLVKETFEEYLTLNKPRHQTMLEIYQSFSTFKEEKLSDYATVFKVNKAHEIVEKIVPRIVAKNPRWIVTPKMEDFYPDQKLPPMVMGDPESMKLYNEALKAKRDKTADYSQAIQEYLAYLFNEYGFDKYLRLWVKNMVVYGKGRAKISYKYETVRRIVDRTEAGDQIEENVIGEYPYIDVKSWTQVLTDPRYRTVKDMPAYIEIIDGVRFNELARDKEYFNIDKLRDIVGVDSKEMNLEEYTKKVRSIAGIASLTCKTTVDKNSLQVVKYYGYFDKEDSEDGSTEKIYEITTVNNILVIGCKEITKIPFIEIDCFEDTETNHAIGFVEPILGLQDELNFQKNAASNYINQALFRTVLWSPTSGIDPRDLMKPYGVIPVSGDVPTAQANMVELAFRTISPDYFQFQNDIERQIQGQTFTVDTANQLNQQALTNTATGAKLKAFESNSVISEITKHFEQGVKEIAYMLLQEAFENMEDNIVLKKMDADEYWEFNKELLRDAIQRYNIEVEVNSSSFDDLQSRRDDATGFFNTLLQAQQAGVKVDLEKGVEDVITTYERRDPKTYILPPDMTQIAQQLPPTSGPLPPAPQTPQGPEELTQEVANGNITSASQV